MKRSLLYFACLLCCGYQQSSFAQNDSNYEVVHNANKVSLWSNPEVAISEEKALLRTVKADSLMATSAQLIAVGYSILSQWDSAITYHYLCLKHAENAHDEKTIGLAYNNIGLVHLQLRDTLNARAYLELAEPFIKDTSTPQQLSRFYRSKYLVLPKNEKTERETLIRKGL